MISIQEFFSTYGLPSVIITLVLIAVKVVFELFLAKKLNRAFLTYIPFLLGILLEYLYDLIFIKHAFIITEKPLYAGLLCASIATAIYVLAKNIVEGNFAFSDTLSLLIEGIIEGYVKKDLKKTAVISIVKYVKEADEKQKDQEKIKEIYNLIKEYAEDGFTEQELTSVSALILQASQSVKKD